MESPASKETGRVEAFSDGVFAIAITLLILNIKVPAPDTVANGAALLTQLLAAGPVYLSYATSFLTILVMWVNHHTMFRQIRRSDHGFLLLNGLLLMAVTVVPFPTSLLAAYLPFVDPPGGGPHAVAVAAALYNGTFAAIALLYTLLWWYALGRRLVIAPRVPFFSRRGIHRYGLGPAVYLVALALAFVSPLASLILDLAMAVFYALPPPAHDSPKWG